VHSFEKLHTADEYQGGKKRVDGADELADHAEALEELDLREVVRSRERAQSLLRVDAMFEGSAGDLEGEPGAGGIPYDEWEEKTRSYRPGWCSVFVETAPPAKDREAVSAGVRTLLHRHRGQVRALREKLARMEAKRAWRARQSDGPEVDTDAVVDRFAAMAAGHSGPDKLYRSRRPHAPGLAVLVLLDASLSTDAWVDGRRVLDVAKASLVVLGEALSGAEAEVGVAAFHSNTRRDCRFLVLKGFAEPWSAAPPRLAPLTPRGYTRIGPALRHATTLLDRCEARRKLLVLVSDGKPTDYDRYEGRYGIADVRRAVGEAEQRGVRTFGLTIEKEARGYLAQMFGPGGYEVLPRPEALAEALARVTAELS
jgi:nitric oxide reductase NorD protein